MAVEAGQAHMPAGGVWRVARADNPLWARVPKAHELRAKSAGYRYDVPGLKTVYFSTTLIGCYTEVLADLRPKPDLAALVEEEWRVLNHLAPGHISASWRHRRTEIKVKISPDYAFLDVESAETLDMLDAALRPSLVAIGYRKLDFGLIHGPDRRVTRLIAKWASEVPAESAEGDDIEESGYRFAGVRYMSCLDQQEPCWAVWLDGVEVEEVERRGVERESHDLLKVAGRYKLRMF